MTKKQIPVFQSEAHRKFSTEDSPPFFSEFCKQNDLHHCMTVEDDNEIYWGKGPSIIICYEDESNYLWAGNDEAGYESIVDFCPFCGFESKYKIMRWGNTAMKNNR